jgi:murein DD-endopeptidase MepM/ murein hydrolase activator NlpD
MGIAAVLALVGALLGPSTGGPSSEPGQLPDYGSYSWPLRGRILRGYEPPPSRYESGHRGIDIAAPFGTTITAPKEGVVAFAGWVAGALFISIDHPDGIRTTYSWLSETFVQKGQAVTRGSSIGRSGHGHADVPEPHLHFGARVGSDYLDPMLLLEGADASDLIHLAPLEPSWWLEIRGPPPPERHLQ